MMHLRIFLITVNSENAADIDLHTFRNEKLNQGLAGQNAGTLWSSGSHPS